MMIEPIKLSDVPMRATNTANLVEKYLKDFWEPSAVAGKVKVPVGRKARYVTMSYRSAVKRLGLPILVMQRGNDVYVVKKSAAPGAATPKGG